MCSRQTLERRQTTYSVSWSCPSSLRKVLFQSAFFSSCVVRKELWAVLSTFWCSQQLHSSWSSGTWWSETVLVFARVRKTLHILIVNELLLWALDKKEGYQTKFLSFASSPLEIEVWMNQSSICTCRFVATGLRANIYHETRPEK